MQCLRNYISFCWRYSLNGRCWGKIFCIKMYWTPAKMLLLANVYRPMYIISQMLIMCEEHHAPQEWDLHCLQHNDRAMIHWVCNVTNKDQVSWLDLLEKRQLDDLRGPLYWQGLTLIPAWISNHMPKKVWDKITYPLIGSTHNIDWKSPSCF